jgi:putative tricarboxylic transport membrane protein
MTTGRGLRLGEAALGGGVLALGLFVAVQTALIKVAPSNATIGPRLFPFLVAGGLIVVGALLLREALFGDVAHERDGLELDWPAVALVSAGLIAQMLLLETLGWILATTLLFVAVARAFADRRLVLNAAIGLVLTSLAFVLFNQGLGLNLPAGTLVERLLPGGDEDGEP